MFSLADALTNRTRIRSPIPYEACLLKHVYLYPGENMHFVLYVVLYSPYISTRKLKWTQWEHDVFTTSHQRCIDVDSTCWV